jgi:hypothetical protein
MNSQKINDWLQIVGLFGVIGSLIFVGLQLRQTQAIALSETYYNRTATSIDMNVGVLSSPEALSGISKIYRNEFDELTMPEAVALEYLIANSLTTLENNHLQYQAGFLSQEHWDKNLKELDCTLTVPLFREVATYWNFRDSFSALIADAMQKIPTDAENCWTYNWGFPMD